MCVCEALPRAVLVFTTILSANVSAAVGNVVASVGELQRHRDVRRGFEHLQFYRLGQREQLLDDRCRGRAVVAGRHRQYSKESQYTVVVRGLHFLSP